MCHYLHEAFKAIQLRWPLSPQGPAIHKEGPNLRLVVLLICISSPQHHMCYWRALNISSSIDPSISAIDVCSCKSIMIDQACSAFRKSKQNHETIWRFPILLLLTKALHTLVQTRTHTVRMWAQKRQCRKDTYKWISLKCKEMVQTGKAAGIRILQSAYAHVRSLAC